MPRHLLQHLTVVTAVALGGCVDEPAPANQPTRVVLPDLSAPTVRARPQPPAAHRRAPPLPSGPWRGYVDADWVTPRLTTGALHIVDLRPAAQFARGHLPGAVNDPEGRTLLATVLARRRPGAPSRPVVLPTESPKGTVVLVHGGQDLSQRAVAARSYLLLYAAGAETSRLAILRGGYVTWRRQRRPRTTAAVVTGPPHRIAPTPRPGAVAAKPRAVLLTDPMRLAAARKQPRTQLVRVGPLRSSPRPGRPKPGWLRFGLAPLELAPQPTLGVRAELRTQFGPLLSGREKTRLVAFSDAGLWASLLWLTLKTRLGRPDRLNTVYLGSPPLR